MSLWRPFFFRGGEAHHHQQHQQQQTPPFDGVPERRRLSSSDSIKPRRLSEPLRTAASERPGLTGGTQINAKSLYFMESLGAKTNVFFSLLFDSHTF